MTLIVRTITANQHREWVASRPSVSFLQLPEWGEVKVGWTSESLGWFDGARLVGAGLVLYRPVPKIKARSLAYIPEGPDIDWLRERLPGATLDDWLNPLLAHCKARGAFQLKMGPALATRRWETDTIKAVIAERADGAINPPARISDLVADWHSTKAMQVVERLQSRGWVQEGGDEAGFGDVQPRYVFQLALANRSIGDIFGNFNQLWRRNIRKSEKAGVEVTQGGFADLAAFHSIYVETAQRDQFTPRSLTYFERMWQQLNDVEPGRLSLYLASHEGHVAAATLMIRVGTHAWYSYGASTTADREVRPSNALQWRMITDAHKAGCEVFDLRGISDTLNPDNHLFGLVQFKLGTGGFAQEYVGEWDYVLRSAWAKGYRAYQSRRG
ncbi:MAG: peptidoglycan bridge formation glycyltransferase FemA/FemB family protein [Actinobacteria bacterium]|nr:peptidoglycan bridge formation glycyltransferase FemA/FemB family protein [Actinomycetota bacterium]